MSFRGRRGELPVPRFKIFQRDGFRCVYCGRSSTDDGVKLQVDHLKPLANGGGSSRENLVTACADCNLEKRGTPLPEGLQEEIANRIKQRNEELGWNLQPSADQRETATTDNMPVEGGVACWNCNETTTNATPVRWGAEDENVSLVCESCNKMIEDGRMALPGSLTKLIRERMRQQMEQI
jgi:hypothetical protein